MSSTVQDPVDLPPAALPEAYIASSSADSASDLSQTTALTVDTSPATSQPHTSTAAHPSRDALPSDSHRTAPRDASHGPFRPSTPPPQPSMTWRQPAPDASLASPSSAVASPERGAKRTASGAFKLASPSALSPLRSGKHARNASTDSAQSRVSELSAQLRARLSYAMVKVQNGWENKSIGEVEQLAAHSPYLSPKGRVVQRQGYHGRSRGISDAAVTRASRALQQPTFNRDAGVHGIPNPFQSVPHLAIPHQGATAATGQTSPSSAHARPATSHEHDKLSSASKLPGYTSIRATTPTPQEQDALDTLMAMSSPAHSVHYSRRHPNGTSTAASSNQGSPTRATFPASGAGSKPGSMPPPTLRPGSSRGSGSSMGNEGPHVIRSAATAPVRTNGDVERLLDEMRAYSSDDGDGNDL